MRLVATGSTEHMSNHGETTLDAGRDVMNGHPYLISFRAKWIHGSRQVLTRLYFNRLARTTFLEAPSLHGTPGQPNTALTANIGPTYAGFRHGPPVPAAFAPVTISVQAADPDGVATMTLRWRPDGGDWQSVSMTQDGADPGLYHAQVAGRAAGSIVQFYVAGVDGLGAVSTYPAAGTNSRALFQVDDGLAATNGLHNIRLVTLTADADDLFRTINLMSNERIGCTLLYDEREIFYDVGLRLKGSEHSRTTTPRLGFNVGFTAEQRFRGIHRTVALDRSESTGFGQREMLIHQTLNHCGGVPTKYHDLVQIMAPRPAYTGSAELQLARYGDVFLDDQYQDGSDGTVFEYELVYQLNSTDNGSPEGNKVPAPDSVLGTAILDLGNDKEAYRWTYLIKNNEDKDDYGRIIEFAKAMGMTGNAFLAQIANIVDVDQWLRATAVNALSGVGDSYGGDGAAHNVQFYVRPEDNRVLYFPHDIDAFFSATRPIVPNSDLNKFLAVPAYARAYYCHLLDIIDTTYNGTYMARWANHFGRLLPAQDFAGHLAFLVQRANYVVSQVNAVVPAVAFAITSNGGNNFGTTNNIITLTGTAPLGIKTIEVGGVRYPISWINTITWSLLLPLFNGPNALTVQGINNRGLPVSNAVDTITITITNSGTGAYLPLVINEWMADNAGPSGLVDDVDGAYQDWFELYNPNPNEVNIAGFYLTDSLAQPAKWQIPAGTIVPALGFLLVWADNQPAQNSLDPSGHLHAGFQLNNDGEVLALYSPGLVAQHIVPFGPQFENVSQGLYPDGNTNGIYFMTNWTPRAANTLAGPLRLISFEIEPGSGLLTLTWTAIQGRTYRLEYKDALDEPQWTPREPDILATGETVTAADLPPPGGWFYRLHRLD